MIQRVPQLNCPCGDQIRERVVKVCLIWGGNPCGRGNPIRLEKAPRTQQGKPEFRHEVKWVKHQIRGERRF